MPSRNAISQEDLPYGSRAESVASSTSGRPITRGQSAKTVRSVPSAAAARKVVTPQSEPMYAAFQILPPVDQRPKAAVIAGPTAVPLTDSVSVESL